jgi:hypothetical protein
MISVLDWLDGLNWIDGKPLRLEPYRREIFRKAFDTYRDNGMPQYTIVVAGRAKKNSKSTDLILAGLFCLTSRDSSQGSDVLLVANDEDQARDDLDLAKKIVAANPHLVRNLEIFRKEIRRRDQRGDMRILPANNALGQHGKTAVFIGFDEIHGFANWDLMEALQPDPTRYSLQWVTSYDSLLDYDGAPLHDLKRIGMSGADPSMLFSWYSADYCTDPDFAGLPPDERANPSMGSWPEGRAYLDQQRRRLPSARFRRLHHNLPGAPQGAFFNQGMVEDAIVAGHPVSTPAQYVPPHIDGVDYLAFVDMSGGSSDDAVLAISYWDGSRAVLVHLINQGEAPPFNPRHAVTKFAATCKRYGIRTVHGDRYAGETFRRDFADHGMEYVVTEKSKTDLYEELEVALNTAQASLLDHPKLRNQLLSLVRRGAGIDHPSGQHDDFANAAAGAIVLVNPDLGAPTPAMLEFYRRQIEAAAAAQDKPTEVGVTIPADVSTVLGPSGKSYIVDLVDGARICRMSATDAKAMLATSRDAALISANLQLLHRLKSDADIPSTAPGTIVTDTYDTKPQRRTTMAEEIGGFARRRAASVHETLRMIGRSL